MGRENSDGSLQPRSPRSSKRSGKAGQAAPGTCSVHKPSFLGAVGAAGSNVREEALSPQPAP